MDIRFDEYNAYLDTVIQEVTDAGIQLTTGQYIDYAVCAGNFFELYGGSGKCVGERNAQELTVIFYTAPLTTHITFSESGLLREFFRKGMINVFCTAVTLQFGVEQNHKQRFVQIAVSFGITVKSTFGKYVFQIFCGLIDDRFSEFYVLVGTQERNFGHQCNIFRRADKGFFRL